MLQYINNQIVKCPLQHWCDETHGELENINVEMLWHPRWLSPPSHPPARYLNGMYIFASLSLALHPSRCCSSVLAVHDLTQYGALLARSIRTRQIALCCSRRPVTASVGVFQDGRKMIVSAVPIEQRSVAGGAPKATTEWAQLCSACQGR